MVATTKAQAQGTGSSSPNEIAGLWRAERALYYCAKALQQPAHDHKSILHIAHGSEGGFQNDDIYWNKGSFASDRYISRYRKPYIAVGGDVYVYTGFFEFGEMAITAKCASEQLEKIKRDLVKRGCVFYTSNLFEVISHLIAISLYPSLEDKIIDAARQLTGPVSIIAATSECLLGMSTLPDGKTLAIGKLREQGEQDGGWILASDAAAIDRLDADFVRQIRSGELVIISDEGARSLFPFAPIEADNDLDVDLPPLIPPQGVGLHFEIDADYRISIAPPESIDGGGNNIKRLNWLCPEAFDLATALREELASGNTPHYLLIGRLDNYISLFSKEVSDINFQLLFISGLRLRNANESTQKKIADGELPPLSVTSLEQLESLLQLHGTILMCSAEGAEIVAMEERYRRSPEQERQFRETALNFAKKLQGHDEIITPTAAEAVLNAVEQIGVGEEPVRAAIAGHGAIQNVAITITAAATVAALPIVAGAALGTGGAIAGGLAGFIACESLKKSKPFAAAITPISERLDKLAEANSPAISSIAQSLKKHALFLLKTEKEARELANSGAEFQWLKRSLNWIKMRR